MSIQKLKATLVAGRVSTDLSSEEIETIVALIGDRMNVLTAQHAWSGVTEPERRRLNGLMNRLENVRLAMRRER